MPNSSRLAHLALMIVVIVGHLVTSSARAANDRPNILIAISDDQSFAHTSAAGCRAVRTPAFDRVAEAGVLFTSALAASPGCSPSRAALLTGRHPWQLEHAGTHASAFPAKFVTFPDLLENAGYFVGYTGKGWGPGNWKAGGRERNPAGPLFEGKRVSGPRPGGVASDDYAGNFRTFLEARPAGQPFCFWFGAHEPHRKFEPGSGLKAGKRLEDVEVPPFLPDTPEVRSDLLDYFLEIEWFDRQLAAILELLEQSGELQRTLVIVTSDNGMAFPRAKANCYDYGIHVPLAVAWPAQVPGGRAIDDPVGFVDLTATILDAAGVEHPHGAGGELGISGHSIVDVLRSDESGRVDPTRKYAFSARERHSSSRFNNLGYPQRAIRSREYLYIRNFAPERWPAGDPQKYEPDGSLGPMHGAYHDIDGSPTLDLLVARRDDPAIARFLELAVAKRAAEELYDVERDPGCVQNLAATDQGESIRAAFAAELDRMLNQTGDPRAGADPDVFESYRRYSAIRQFPAR